VRILKFNDHSIGSKLSGKLSNHPRQ
jgi:hypothetical protein